MKLVPVSRVLYDILQQSFKDVSSSLLLLLPNRLPLSSLLPPNMARCTPKGSERKGKEGKCKKIVAQDRSSTHRKGREAVGGNGRGVYTQTCHLFPFIFSVSFPPSLRPFRPPKNGAAVFLFLLLMLSLALSRDRTTYMHVLPCHLDNDVGRFLFPDMEDGMKKGNWGAAPVSPAEEEGRTCLCGNELICFFLLFTLGTAAPVVALICFYYFMMDVEPVSSGHGFIVKLTAALYAALWMWVFTSKLIEKQRRCCRRRATTCYASVLVVLVPLVIAGFLAIRYGVVQDQVIVDPAPDTGMCRFVRSQPSAFCFDVFKIGF